MAAWEERPQPDLKNNQQETINMIIQTMNRIKYLNRYLLVL